MKIIFYFEDNTKEEYETTKESVKVGRGSDCDINITKPGFSRSHALIENEDGEFFVTDLQSTNGIYIDGNRIQSSERVVVKSFFNLSFGSASRVELLDHSFTAQSQNLLDFPSSDPIKESDKNFRPKLQDREKTIEKDFSNRGPKRASSSKSSQAFDAKPFLLPILVIACGFIYYYVSQTQDNEISEVAVVEQQVTAGPQITESQFVSGPLLIGNFAQKSCNDSVRNWCVDAGILESNKEGAIIEGKSIIIYMNMVPFFKETHTEAFLALAPLEQLEFLLLRRVFTSNIVKALMGQTQFDNIQVIGVVGQNEELSPQLAIKILRNIDLKDRDKFFFYSIFDLLINQGQREEVSKISDIYEKIPLN